MFDRNVTFPKMFITYYYRNLSHFCGIYRCANAGESLTNCMRPDGLHIDKIHKMNEFLFIIISTGTCITSYIWVKKLNLEIREEKIVSGLLPIGFSKVQIPFKNWFQPIKLR